MSVPDEQQDSPYRSPLAPPEDVPGPGSETDLRRKKNRLLAWMLGVHFVTGFAGGIFPQDSPAQQILGLIVALAFVAILYNWCQYDADERGFRLWPRFGITLVVCPGPLLVMPIYFLTTRGVRGLLSTLIAVTFQSLCIAILAAGAFAGLFLSEIYRLARH